MTSPHLERMLVASPAPALQTDIDRAKEESNGLGLFVRSLVGLDRAAATEAMFYRYLTDTTFTATQLRFVQHDRSST